MISRTHAKAQVMRLAGTNYFPMKPEAIRELVDALQLRAKSNEQATLAISRWLEDSPGCPTVADINRVCRETETRATEYPEPCDECIVHGGNFRMVTVPHKDGMVVAFTRCDCARGRLLQAREEEERRRAG